MPRAIQCEECNQSHLLRDEVIGHRIRCDCGRIQTVSASAPSVPAQTGWMDSAGVQLGAVGLLLVSLLVLGSVVAWVAGLDMGSNPNETQTASLTTKDPQPPGGKDKPKPAKGKMPGWKGEPEVVTGAVAEAVTAHLKHEVAEIRGAALRALRGLGSAVRKPAPTLFQLLLGRWTDEKDPMVRKALVEVLEALLTTLKPEEMKEMVPFLQHKDK